MLANKKTEPIDKKKKIKHRFFTIENGPDIL